jgi:hypothetical protein
LALGIALRIEGAPSKGIWTLQKKKTAEVPCEYRLHALFSIDLFSPLILGDVGANNEGEKKRFL